MASGFALSMVGHLRDEEAAARKNRPRFVRLMDLSDEEEVANAIDHNIAAGYEWDGSEKKKGRKKK